MSQDYQVFVRNAKKYGKIIRTYSPRSSEDIYMLAASTQSLPAQDVLLIKNGQIIQRNSQPVHLQQKSILHIINLGEVERENISISIRSLNGTFNTLFFQISSDCSIQEFIETNLKQVYGQSQSELILVHIGRQLQPNSTFRSSFIPNHSQIFCVNLQEVRLSKGLLQKGKLKTSLPAEQLQQQEGLIQQLQAEEHKASPQDLEAKESVEQLQAEQIREASDVFNGQEIKGPLDNLQSQEAKVMIDNQQRFEQRDGSILQNEQQGSIEYIESEIAVEGVAESAIQSIKEETISEDQETAKERPSRVGEEQKEQQALL